VTEVTDEMVEAYLASEDNDPPGVEWHGEAVRRHLAAVLTVAERELRERVAEALDRHATALRGTPFRRGDVGIEFINGIEDAADMVITGKFGTP
jgi:hypothetical protein